MLCNSVRGRANTSLNYICITCYSIIQYRISREGKQEQKKKDMNNSNSKFVIQVQISSPASSNADQWWSMQTEPSQVIWGLDAGVGSFQQY